MPERIVLGLGNNIDYEIVWDTRVIEALINRYTIRQEELDIDHPIRNERDLLISILSFLQQGIGGERFVDSDDAIEDFSQRFQRQVTLGGTSVRAAIAMRKLGYTSALHLVTTNHHVRRLLPPDSPYVCSNSGESSYPHLIVQFAKGTCICASNIHIVASRANRLIYHNDKDNIVMQLNEEFATLVTEAKVFLISGFNAMQSEVLLAERLTLLKRILGRLPGDAMIYYEDASFFNPQFNHHILQSLAHRITIFGLNEDELQGHLHRAVDPLDPVQIKNALAELQTLVPVPTIVIHSMYWALAYGQNAADFAAALHGGVTMATTRFLYGDDFSEAQYNATASLPPNPAGATFAHAIQQTLGQQVCCVPVAQVDQLSSTTVGLGDAFVGGFLPPLAHRA